MPGTTFLRYNNEGGVGAHIKNNLENLAGGSSQAT
jgi:hypothetical protein